MNGHDPDQDGGRPREEERAQNVSQGDEHRDHKEDVAGEVIDTSADRDSTLVETPESRPTRPRRRRRAPASEDGNGGDDNQPQNGKTEAAE
jgi:hypothetical protein